MACVSRSVISVAANSSFSFKTLHLNNRIYASKFKIKASSQQGDDCNIEECAPDKEVGKLSVEWLADEKTRVVGTFPPKKKGWTGYTEKDTAGQKNIYSVEPTVYLAESAISSGTAGSSSDGSENTAAITAGIGLIFVAAASSILLQMGKYTPQVQTTVYSGPSLSYYIKEFTPPQIIQASFPTTSESETSTATSQSESSVATSQSVSSSTTESQVQQLPAELESSASTTDTVS